MWRKQIHTLSLFYWKKSAIRVFENRFLVFEKFVQSLWILKWKTCANPVFIILSFWLCHSFSLLADFIRPVRYRASPVQVCGHQDAPCCYGPGRNSMQKCQLLVDVVFRLDLINCYCFVPFFFFFFLIMYPFSFPSLSLRLLWVLWYGLRINVWLG